MPKIYHYTAGWRWDEIQKDGVLKAKRRFIFWGDGSGGMPNLAHENAIFSFHGDTLKPYLDGQTDTKAPQGYDPKFIETLRKQTANFDTLHLLEIDLPNTDNLYVCECAVFRGLRALTEKPENYETLKDQAYDLYWQSVIPYNSYRLGDYEEPEVIHFGDIPLQYIQSIRQSDEFIPEARRNLPKPTEAERTKRIDEMLLNI